MRKVKALLKDQAGLEKNKIGLAVGFPGGSVIKRVRLSMQVM